MKLATKMLTWALFVLFTLGIAIAQEENVVHYGSPKGTTKRPDFSKAVVGIDFPGAPAATAVYLLSKLDAGVNQVPRPCNAPKDIVCLEVRVGSGFTTSGYGSSSWSGTRGGGSSSGGFSGTLYPVTVYVTLIKYNKGLRTRVVLGEAQTEASQGNGYEYTASYGRSGGGGFNSSGTTTLASTYDNAANKAIDSLFSKSLLVRFVTTGEYAHWYKGADLLVQEANF